MSANLSPFRALLTALLAALVLAGCAAVVPPSAIPDATARALPADQGLLTGHANGIARGTPAAAWWEALHDDRLNTLVRQAETHNPGLHAALATVRQARALAGLAERENRPAGRLDAQAQRVRPPNATVDPYEMGLGRPPARTLAAIEQVVGWEIDLFGRIDTAAAIAERQADLAEADAHAARALLQAEVVRHYVLLRRYQHEWALAAETRDHLQRLHATMTTRVAGGLSDPRQSLSARRDRQQAEAELPLLAAAIAREEAALAVLTGQSPAVRDKASDELLAAGPLPQVPNAADLSGPDDLLARRPDVRRADAALRAALGEVTLAERAYLPRLSLSLALGLTGRFSTLGRAESRHYSAGPVLQWDWLSGGRLAAREAATRAGSERAWHEFEQTVLKAIEDSDNALRSWLAACQAMDRASAAESAARAAADHTRRRFAAGLETPAQSLEAEIEFARSRRDTLNRHSDALLAYAGAQLALAAWQPEPANAIAPVTVNTP